MLFDTGPRGVEGRLVYLKDHHKEGGEGGGVKGGMQGGMEGRQTV